MEEGKDVWSLGARRVLKVVPTDARHMAEEYAALSKGVASLQMRKAVSVFNMVEGKNV
jgi:hypothetical protein